MSGGKDMNEYMKRRWRIRRRKAISILGGQCEDCGSVHRLQFDHRDPKQKMFTIARGSSFSDTRFWEEIRKCQLLCRKCHVLKSKSDGSIVRGSKRINSKLTKSKVLACRARHKAGVSFRDLAKEYSISHTTVRSAVLGVTWSHL